MADNARKQTDKQLKKMEREIGGIYKNDPALKRIQKEYAKYMNMVQKRTQDAYKAYIGETDADTKAEKKKAYMDEIRALTIDSKEYKKLIDEITTILAQVNQNALNVVNNGMLAIYAENYNQVAEECRKAGIQVNE